LFAAAEVTIKEETLLEHLTSETSKKAFASLSEKIEALDFLTADNYKLAISEVQSETGIKGKALFKPVRIALTGSENGPELPAIAEILGKDKVIEFLKRWH